MPDPTPPCGDETRFRALADLSPDILSIFDREGRLVFNSAAAWQTHGYRPEDLEGRSTFELIHPEDRAAVEAAFAQVLIHPEEPVRVRYRYRNADGSHTWMEAVGRNELANPALGGVICISRDISAQVAAEQAQRREHEQFRMLFAANPLPMMIFDLATRRFVEVNTTAQALYGFSPEEFRRLTLEDIRRPEELPLLGPVIEQLGADPAARIEGLRRHRAKDGRIFDVEIVAQRIDWMGRPACFMLAHEITEQLKLQAKLQQTQKLESLGLLAGGIAHDFNNLLTAVLGHASIVAEDLPEGSTAHESMRLLQETALRAADLCHQMLAYSGRGQFAVRILDLSTFVRSTVELLKTTIRPHIALQFDLAPGLPPIEGDATQLQQVAMNLVLNAVDAIGTDHGTIRLATGLVQADRQLLETMYLAPQLAEGPYISLQVTDTGCGMAPATAARVFDPFFSTKFTGRGLGLAAVLGIVRGHHGAIKVETAPGRGSTFTLLFPVSTRNTPVPAPPPAAPELPRDRARTVLIVDDEDCVRRTVQTMLRRQGIQGLVAEDGLAGLELFAARHAEIDAVLLDLTMPGMDGVETLIRMRSIAPAARILLMSGFTETEERTQLSHLGHRGFVQKPFTMQALLAKLHSALN